MEDDAEIWKKGWELDRWSRTDATRRGGSVPGPRNFEGDDVSLQVFFAC